MYYSCPQEIQMYNSCLLPIHIYNNITIVCDWKGITLVYKTLLSSKDSAQLFTILFPYKVMLTGIHQ